jgi:catechol 2,3-dioxygenase-like lactoylglutathione lyase family enzyme
MTVNDELVSVRYMVDDVDEAIAFYTDNFGFESARTPRLRSTK